MAKAKKRLRWVRDGTLMLAGYTEIDLRDTQSRRQTWITIKANDRAAERLAARLLDDLNKNVNR